MLVAVIRSLPGTLSFLLVGALLLYVYAMVGWVFFGRADPEHYGSLGRAVLTLFFCKPGGKPADIHAYTKKAHDRDGNGYIKYHGRDPAEAPEGPARPARRPPRATVRSDQRPGFMTCPRATRPTPMTATVG